MASPPELGMQPREKFSNLLATFTYNPNASSSGSTIRPLIGKKRKQDVEEESESSSKRVKRDVSELPPLQDRLQRDLDGELALSTTLLKL